MENIWAELESSVSGGLTPDQQAGALKVLEQIEAGLARATTPSA
ncbi:hypothetical protein AB0J35_28980 [Nonomuraea angiospora]